MSLRFQQKLIIPAASRPLVERPRLLADLEEVITTRRVVALAAPAGWGKTTALAQWAARSALPVAWYTLDAADRDPQLFLDYLLHSVAAFVPGASEIVRSSAMPDRSTTQPGLSTPFFIWGKRSVPPATTRVSGPRCFSTARHSSTLAGTASSNRRTRGLPTEGM